MLMQCLDSSCSALQKDLPDELATLRLEQLNISANPMKELPAVISKMTTLKVLHKSRPSRIDSGYGTGA
jgi:Leucine-rich repeat (LRR) protein